MGGGPHSAFVSHFVEHRWIREEALQGVCEGLRIPGRNEQPRLSVLHDVHDASNFRSDNGEAGGHRLQEDDSERFEQRREYEDFRRRIGTKYLLARQETSEDDSGFDSQRSRERSQACDTAPILPDDDQPNLPARGEQSKSL